MRTEKTNKGTEPGEICGRYGCSGVLSELESEYGCRCAVMNNPPCSHCTTDRTYCPECDWQAGDLDMEDLPNNTYSLI